MRPATDVAEDCKALVRRGYDLCSERYTAARRAESPDALRVLSAGLHEGARVLDLGCGAGIPIGKSLAERFEVTGIDFSSEQIRRARENVPSGTFHCCDVMDYDPPAQSFDAITSFYLLFHLPRAHQIELVKRLHAWLKVGGLVLATVSAVDEAPYLEDDFFGVTMYWTNFSQSAYEATFQEQGFRVLSLGAMDHGYRGAERTEHHPLLLAERL